MEELTDEQAIDKAVDMLKEKGIFDQIRKNCLEDINTKSSYLNLNQRIEGYVDNFLRDKRWDTTLNKNQLRERLRKNINESTSIKNGISHLAEQVINPISFESRIEEQIRELLGIEEELVNEIKKEPDGSHEEIEHKFEDLSDEEKLVSDVSDDENDDLFESKPTEGQPNNGGGGPIKSERELDCFARELDSFLNDKRNTDQVEGEQAAVKQEKYESSISSGEEFDECMD